MPDVSAYREINLPMEDALMPSFSAFLIFLLIRNVKCHINRVNERVVLVERELTIPALRGVVGCRRHCYREHFVISRYGVEMPNSFSLAFIHPRVT